MRILEAADVADRSAREPDARHHNRDAGRDGGAAKQRQPRKNRKARAFWLKQLHTWHWVSAAISLAGMLLFAITGLTLNHASSISAKPVVTGNTGQLPPAMLEDRKSTRLNSSH